MMQPVDSLLYNLHMVNDESRLGDRPKEVNVADGLNTRVGDFSHYHCFCALPPQRIFV